MKLLVAARKRVEQDCKAISDAWERFWFAPVDPFPLAAFRFVFGVLGFTFYAIRMTDYDFYFSDAGVLPYATLQGVVPAGYESLVAWEWLTQNATVGFALHGLLLVGWLLLALGWIGRLGTIGLLVLHLAFFKRNPMITYGPDMVSTAWLVHLAFTDTRAAFRIPLPGVFKGFQSAIVQSRANTLGLRLLQIQVCLVYAYGGWEKLRGLTWWQGDAIWNALANGQLVKMDLGFMAHAPGLVAAITFVTVLWETYFPAMVWIKPIRPYVLIFGVLLHGGIGATMNIPFFSAFMVATYLLFIEAPALRRWARQWV